MPTLYKIIGVNGEALNGGSGSWHLPTRTGRPGKWMTPVVGKIEACARGYHLVSLDGILQWIPSVSALLCEAEGHGDQSSDDEKKTAFREARILRVVGPLNDLTLRLAAADFAWRVLPHFEKEYPSDDRPRKAILAARAFARAEIDDAARSAAESAAWSAARSAARSDAESAAESAAWSAAWSAARSAARSDAESAAWSAAWSAARSAAWSAEVTWQATRLLEIVAEHA